MGLESSATRREHPRRITIGPPGRAQFDRNRLCSRVVLYKHGRQESCDEHFKPDEPVSADSDAVALDGVEFGKVLAVRIANMKERGIIYVATGPRYLAEAEHSVRSVRRVSPKVPTAIISDSSPARNLFDVRLNLPNPEYSFVDKIIALTRTPFEKTLFLDTDTFVIEPLEEIFELLDRFDIAAAADPGRYLYPIAGVATSFPELNSGVVLYRRNTAVLELIRRWDEMYRLEIASKMSAGVKPWHDQLAFTRAIYDSNVNFFMLPPEFNARVLMPQAVSGPIRIAHCRLKRPDRYESDLSKLNESIYPRNINPNPRRIPEIVKRTLSLFLILQR